jgi:glyoxylase-like metal-dependent hydrolase (beta-lactamase superfamily II)
MKTLASFRRHLLAAALLGLSAAGAIAPARAAAPMLKTQAPGYYRFMLGDFEITALSDGTLALPVDKVLHTQPERVQAALKDQHIGLPAETSVNAFLINTGSKLVLVDAGAGTLWGPAAGKLLASLKAAGYTPEQVDEVYITHLHTDHIGGAVANGAPVYPNAIVRADQREVDYWLSKVQFQGAVASMEPLLKARRFKAFSGDTDLVPGVRAVATHGHTEGHTIYLVESQGQKLYLIGDLIHVGAVQFPDPTVTIDSDTDRKLAREQRLRVFARAAQEGAMIGAAHLSFPGVGYLKPAGQGYQWIPINYSALKQ